MSSELGPVLHYAQGLSVIITVFYVALLNSSISRRIFGIVTNAGRPNSAASFSQQIRPASAEVVQIFSARPLRQISLALSVT
jgi:hypothetical protein